MTEQTIQTYEETEISLLNILVTLAESWKLLVFCPFIAGVLAGGLSLLLPKTFESVAIVRMTEEEVALLHAAPVLDPLIEKFSLLADANGIMEDARQGLKARLNFVVDKKTKLATVHFKGASPESAQALGRAAMATLMIELQPKGKERDAILQEIAINNQLIADGVIYVDRQGSKQNEKNNAKSQIANLKLNNLDLNLKLQTKGSEVFAQEPSFPQRKVAPKRSFIILSAIFTTGFALLIFVFIRKAFILAAQDAESASKLEAIKYSLGLKRHNHS